MTDKTTIAMSASTKSKLTELKRVDGESFESVVLMLIANYSEEDSGLDETRVREIAQEEINDKVTMRALE